MDRLPDFTSFGYKLVETLGNNYFGGRTTYLATKIDTNRNVVIKQFKFATTDSDWLGYKAYQREIQILEQLEHPGIPKYLDSFETDNGFCMVQEYKAASSLAVYRSYDPEEIKLIAIKILEILIYLQNRVPSVIHRDLKPENILLSEAGKVYLVDFGFARLGGENLAMSSVTLGTLGFMPPEQLYNRQLTTATDLYSLGMTLICLLTQTKSSECDDLIDEDNNISFQHLLPQLSKRWLHWLQTLVQRNPKHRYQDAAEALEQLQPIYIFKQPSVQLSTPKLNFTASSYGEKLTQTITVTNSVADTILEGNWQVAPHPSDPPHTPHKHPWISFSEPKFQGNLVQLQVTADTSHLLAKSNYQREIILQTNSYPEVVTMPIRVQTGRIDKIKIPYLQLLISFIVMTISGCLLSLFANTIGLSSDGIFLFSSLGFLISIVMSLPINSNQNSNWKKIMTNIAMGTIVAGCFGTGLSYVSLLRNRPPLFLAYPTIFAIAPIITAYSIKRTKKALEKANISVRGIYAILPLLVIFELSFGYSIIDCSRIGRSILLTTLECFIDFNNFSHDIVLTNRIIALFISIFFLYYQFKNFGSSKKYRQSKNQLIEP